MVIQVPLTITVWVVKGKPAMTKEVALVCIQGGLSK